MPNEFIIKMRGIRKTFPGVVALDGVDFELVRGEVHVLLGENGAGKSTLMKIMSGAYPKDGGEIVWENRPLEIKSPKHARQLGISIIYQEFNLIPQLSAADNIFLGHEPHFAGIVHQKKILGHAAKLLDALGVRFDPRTSVRALSVAQQQMVEVAKALSVDAKILIMDEPTSALTDIEIQELFATIRRLQAQGVAIVYISHRLEELFAIGDRVTVLRDGKYIATHRVTEVSAAQLVRLMANRELKEHYPKQKAQAGEELLRVENLTRGAKLKDISFSLRRGEVLGVAGVLGAGRTELARAIFGVDPIDAGRIWVKGQEVRIKSPAAAIKLRLGFLTEDRKTQGLVMVLSVQHNMSLPSLKKLSRLGVLNAAAEEKQAGSLVADLRIRTPGLNQRVLYLSGGNQQKVVLAKWLGCAADILIFDECTRGIDVGAKVEIYQLMNRLTAQGVGIIMISSELPEILGMSDRILVLHQGCLQGEFDAGEATQERILSAALGQRAEGVGQRAEGMEQRAEGMERRV
ncbi:MAG: sugar ABC transporter ATP-binding protein [bacterium]